MRQAGPLQPRPPSATGVTMWMIDQLKGASRHFDYVVQVGAHVGEEVAPFRRAGVKQALMIEAAEGPYAQLCAAIGEGQDLIPFLGVCSSLDGEPCDFFVGSAAQASSMLKPKRHLQEYRRIRFEEPIRMTTRTVDSIVAEVERTHPGFDGRRTNLFCLDTQGAELKVMQGATRLLQFCQTICTEVSYDLYEGGASLQDLQGFLGAYGFRLHTNYTNAKGWGEAMFCKPAP